MDAYPRYKNQHEALKILPKEIRAEVLMALDDYAFDGTVPEMSDVALAMFTVLKISVDSSKAKAEAGRKGGKAQAEAKQEPSKDEAEVKQTSSRSQAEAKQDASKPQANEKREIKNEKQETRNENSESVTTQSTVAREEEPAPTPRKKGTSLSSYGKFNNVLLTSKELEAFKKEHPDNWQETIDKLSSHIASTGKFYQNHHATLEKWSMQDKERQRSSPQSQTWQNPALNYSQREIEDRDAYNKQFLMDL